jgi:hypothetical protein
MPGDDQQNATENGQLLDALQFIAKSTKCRTYIKKKRNIQYITVYEENVVFFFISATYKIQVRTNFYNAVF